MAKEEKIERGLFEEVHIGSRFNHNEIAYTKVSRSYAEIVDNSLLQTQSNVYFDGTTTIHASVSHLRRPKRKD